MSKTLWLHLCHTPLLYLPYPNDDILHIEESVILIMDMYVHIEESV